MLKKYRNSTCVYIKKKKRFECKKKIIKNETMVLLVSPLLQIKAEFSQNLPSTCRSSLFAFESLIIPKTETRWVISSSVCIWISAELNPDPGKISKFNRSGHTDVSGTVCSKSQVHT